MRFLIAILVLCSSFTSILLAQNAFVNSYNIAYSHDYRYIPEPVIISSYDGGSVVMSLYGATVSLFKVDRDGQTVWAKSFKGNYITVTSIIETKDHGYCITGEMSEWSGGGAGSFILKTDEFGNQLWTKRYKEIGKIDLYSICEGSDGSLMAAGTLNTNERYFIMRTDSKGNYQWAKYFKDLTGGLNIQNIRDGHFSVAGWGGFTKIDSSGNILWSKYFGKMDYSYNTRDGGFILSSKAKAPLLVKIDSVGNVEWMYKYNHDLDNYFLMGGLNELSDGRIVMTGTQSIGTGKYAWKPWYLILDNKGIMLEAMYGDVEHGANYNLYHTADGGFVSLGGIGHDNDMKLTVTRVDNTARPPCFQILYALQYQETLDIPIDTVYTDNTTTEFLVDDVSFSQTDTIPIVTHICQALGNSIDEKITDVMPTLSPNPASQSLTISLKETPPTADISIIDITGRTLYRTFLKDPEQKIRLDISPLLKGMYFVKVSADGREYTKKLVVE